MILVVTVQQIVCSVSIIVPYSLLLCMWRKYYRALFCVTVYACVFRICLQKVGLGRTDEF